MPIPPEEIAGKRFLVTLRGYDRSEVDAFLRAVAAEQNRLLRRIDDLQATLDSLGPRIAVAEEADQALEAVLEGAAETVGALRRTRLSGQR
jgi:DivIVA domain-containing protein